MKRKPQPPQAESPAPPAAETSPPPEPALVRIPLYYDGSRGPMKVTLRDASRGLKLDGPGLRMVPTPDAQDLLTPSIGGGAFFRAVPLAEVESWTPAGLGEQLARLAAAGEVTIAQYQPAGAPEPQPYLVLDGKTRQRLTKEVA